MADPSRVAVLASGSGSNLQAIIDASLSQAIAATVAVVISDQPAARALDRAKRAGIPTVALPRQKGEKRPAYDARLVDCLAGHNVSWVALAGFMRLLSPTFLAAFSGKVVNIHPSLLPAFPGLHAQRQALRYGVRYSGCTVHFVDDGTDTGPIIAQRVVPVDSRDDEEALAARILREEHKLYPWVLDRLVRGDVQRQGRIVTISSSGSGDTPA
jgi:phosphoribosylglycinamide formyltransferase 1